MGKKKCVYAFHIHFCPPLLRSFVHHHPLPSLPLPPPSLKSSSVHPVLLILLFFPTSENRSRHLQRQTPNLKPFLLPPLQQSVLGMCRRGEGVTCYLGGDLLSEFCCNEGRLVMAHLLPALYVWLFSLLCSRICAFAVFSAAKVRIRGSH